MDYVNKYKNEFSRLMTYYNIPSYMQRSLTRYLVRGEIPGGFLSAVLENNLFLAIGRADSVNERALSGYVKFLYNAAPSLCYGGEEDVKEWSEQGGLVGLYKENDKNDVRVNNYIQIFLDRHLNRLYGGTDES